MELVRVRKERERVIFSSFVSPLDKIPKIVLDPIYKELRFQ